jgi:hypothetical protein
LSIVSCPDLIFHPMGCVEIYGSSPTIHAVMPEKAGIQFQAATTALRKNRTPAFAGMT